MATDIAFAVGVLSLMGGRVPFAAKVFLLTRAAVDDIGAILVIALFYTKDLSLEHLGLAMFLLFLVVAMKSTGRQRRRSICRHRCSYLWFAMLKSGVHPTIAGVALGLLMPALPFYERTQFLPVARRLFDRFEASIENQSRNDQENLLDQIGDLTAGTQAPLDALERALHPWTSYLVMPIFALANAGVPISGTVSVTRLPA